MKLRFSLRLVLFVFALSAFAMYWCVARPTILANRFATAINRRDFKSAKTLLPDFWLFNRRPNSPPLDLVYAGVFHANGPTYTCSSGEYSSVLPDIATTTGNMSNGPRTPTSSSGHRD